MLYHLTAVVFGMVGLTYAAVPLYRTFCQATGYGGTVQHKETVEEKIARHSGSGRSFNKIQCFCFEDISVPVQETS
ncbi:hypothetical protein Bca52824_062095 [Brassica carinata]|uniref:Cytochrome c oxidase assembly protein COX11, mitochondrial n=1 Tax=Brassica carinata TaxID=52824 RepID=A0A8X7U609_BRACI|nr:hypothetical protein Bca52824_062095 [Brassica carinata]